MIDPALPEITTASPLLHHSLGHDLQERDPVILKLANSWLILNVGGGPTDDKPTVTLTTPQDPDQTSAFINLRVADIAASYAQWSARGAKFLTEPKQHRTEIRAYIRDPTAT